MNASAKYPGKKQVINGNGAVAQVMRHVCGGVIGYPITPSTEISELYEAARAEGAVNIWGRHPFFFSPEGEHSAQSGALGAALTGGQFVSNASSSQGILYALESHYVTVGKKIGGFVLQVAARVVSKHSLNVMAGHDDVYALLSSGYTVLFGANPQEAADLAAISYKVSALSLIPVANAMDGFSTSHMLSEARMPEPELLREYLGDPAGRIPCPTLAQELLFGAKGRVVQLRGWLSRNAASFTDDDKRALEAFLAADPDRIEADDAGDLVAQTLPWVPDELHGRWRRQWVNAHAKGTRQLVPALVDVNNPGMTGTVQNQPDFQAGSVDHRTHFAAAVPSLVRQAMAEYSELTGRAYTPIATHGCDDADVVMVGLGSVCDDVQAVLPYLRAQGIKAGLVAVKLLQPFPEAEVVAALAGKSSVIVLERSDQTALTSMVTQALFKARDNADGERYPGIPGIDALPQLTTAIFGLGGHDLQPRHLIAAFKQATAGTLAPLVYLGSQFFTDSPSPRLAEVQDRLRAAYPETELMALQTEANPNLLPEGGLRIRFHSVGGYGTIATGKLLTDILAGVLGLHSKSAPKYGSEKSGAPTNYYITLSPEPVLITNAELEDVEIVISPDHKVFHHTDPLKGLAEGGTFILQSNLPVDEVWAELPKRARKTIRDRHIKFLVVDAFAVAARHAPTPELQTRMMGIAFIGAVVGHVDRLTQGADEDAVLAKVRSQIAKKFGAKGADIVEGNMAVIAEGRAATRVVDYDDPALVALDAQPARIPLRTVQLSAAMCAPTISDSALFDRDYYEEIVARPFREGTIAEAPVLPGAGLFMPAGTAATKDKGLFRRTVPNFDPQLCTGCMECAIVCPDAAIPNTVHEIHDLLRAAIGEIDVPEAQRTLLREQVYALAEGVRSAYRERKDTPAFHDLVAEAGARVTDNPSLRKAIGVLAAELADYPVARTRPFLDAMEKQAPGSGGLFAVNIDPWKCTGCLECIDVCGPNALTPHEQDAEAMDVLGERFAFLSKLPNTPVRFMAGATDSGGDTKRLLLDRNNYYATTGGHGGCRGCGEVTASRLVMATSHALGGRRRKAHLAELEDLVEALRTKLDEVADPDRRARIAAALERLETRLYLYESGPTGNGPASTVVANSTGCSSVYASTMPFNAFTDPWVNSLFQDAQPLAKGIFEGIAAQQSADIAALRTARLELADGYDPSVHDEELRTLSWSHFTNEELALLPTVLTIGGDGATYDIGFGALSRLLASDTPIKVLVLNTGAYSNTGGQASTSSFLGQDSDLARVGVARGGKDEARKELGILASFHPNVFVCATSTALQAHFLRNSLEFLTYTGSPSVMDVYTPCQSEHGIADAHASRRARLAVESRMNPVFVHDPRRGETIHEWYSLEGNPDPDKTWTTTTVEYLDDEGQLQLLTTALTPADFALGEVRFRKHFRTLSESEAAQGVTMDAYVELTESQRAGKVPFLYTTNAKQRLVKVGCDPVIVAMVEARRRYWHLLQYLSGQHVEKLNALHAHDIEELQHAYDDSMKARETSLDDIARAMADLASAAPGAASSGFSFGGLGGTGGAGPAPAGDASPAAGMGPVNGTPIFLDIADQPKCTDCKTCYQDMPEVFERTRIIVDGQARDAARMIPGALEKVTITPEFGARCNRIKANCDAEIIQ